ncbi:MAG TPA: ribose 5-phosphate isomerase B [Pyrinomonadaceae bacterium]|jgi:ribose 5-phosphate isomerase B
MSKDEATRDRVRALVRDVLKNALPAEEEQAGGATLSGPAGRSEGAQASATGSLPTRFIKTAPEDEKGGSQPEYMRDESSKTVITEDDVRGLEEGARLRVAEGARLTPLASDIVRERRIELVRRVSRSGSRASRRVAVGADHGGFKMKEELKALLSELGHRVQDFGTHSEDAVDYPDIAHAVARAVSDKSADVGIIIDGAGVGSAMTANKVPGVRAAACYSVAVARNSREHNDANVLTLGSKTITGAEMREIVSIWLSTELSEERHRKRVAKIQAIERQYNS